MFTWGKGSQFNTVKRPPGRCVYKEGPQHREEDTGKQKKKQKDWTQLKVYTAKGEGRDGFGKKKKKENSSKKEGEC